MLEGEPTHVNETEINGRCQDKKGRNCQQDCLPTAVNFRLIIDRINQDTC